VYRTVLFDSDGCRLFAGTHNVLKVFGCPSATCLDSVSVSWGGVVDMARTCSYLVRTAADHRQHVDTYDQQRSGWLGSRAVSVQDSRAERPGFKSQPRRCPVTVLGKLFAPIVPLFTEQQNW